MEARWTVGVAGQLMQNPPIIHSTGYWCTGTFRVLHWYRNRHQELSGSALLQGRHMSYYQYSGIGLTKGPLRVDIGAHFLVWSSPQIFPYKGTCP